MCNTITLSWPLFTLSSSATQFLPPTVTWPRKLRHLLPRSAATFSFAAGEKGLGPQVRGNDAKRGPTAQRPTFACHYGKQKNCEKNLHKSKQCNSGVLIGAGDIATLHTDQDILLTLKEGRGEGGYNSIEGSVLRNTGLLWPWMSERKSVIVTCQLIHFSSFPLFSLLTFILAATLPQLVTTSWLHCSSCALTGNRETQSIESIDCAIRSTRKLSNLWLTVPSSNCLLWWWWWW